MEKKIAALAIVVMSVAGCGGGGGGGGGGSTFVSGVWRGTATLTENNCNVANTAPTIPFTHTVNQNNEAVVVDTDTGINLIGNIVGDNGFSVDAQLAPNQTVAPGTVCSFAERIRYEGIDDTTGDKNNDTADATITLTGPCNTQPNCVIEYSGVAARGGVLPGPVPSPTVAARADCVLLDKRHYDGDQGCGLIDVGVNVIGNAVVLDPFGSNGSVTFNVGGDPAGANSASSDLTIDGVAGYSCSMDCEAPLSFTVQCVRQDGSTCTEKF